MSNIGKKSNMICGICGETTLVYSEIGFGNDCCICCKCCNDVRTSWDCSNGCDKNRLKCKSGICSKINTEIDIISCGGKECVLKCIEKGFNVPEHLISQHGLVFCCSMCSKYMFTEHELQTTCTFCTIRELNLGNKQIFFDTDQVKLCEKCPIYFYRWKRETDDFTLCYNCKLVERDFCT